MISRLYGHTTGLKLNTKMKTNSQKIEGTVLYYLGFKYSNTKINFKKYEHLKFFSAIIFVISGIYGNTTDLTLNTKMKTKSQKIEGTVLYYLGFKYSNTKINFKSYEHLKFFSAIIFVISRIYGNTTGLTLNTKMKTKSQKI